MRRNGTTIAAGVLLALTTLTACSGGDGGSGGSNSSADKVGAAAEQPVAPDGSVPAPRAADVGSAPGARRAPVSTTSVIRTGQVSLTAKDLDAVRAEVRDLLTALGGSIDKDEASSDPKGRLQHAQMVLRVPVGRFDAALSALKKLGRLQSSDESSKDVTTEVIDVDERVQTLQNSLDDLQRFQRAAKDVGDLLRFEEQITARQSELQSLTAQQSYLAGQSALSTITLELSTPDTYVPPPDALEDAGFLAGLQAGWAGLRTAVVVALTVLGAVLPFAATVLLVGVPAWLLLRTALRRRRTAAPTASAEG